MNVAARERTRVTMVCRPHRVLSVVVGTVAGTCVAVTRRGYPVCAAATAPGPGSGAVLIFRRAHWHHSGALRQARPGLPGHLPAAPVCHPPVVALRRYPVNFRRSRRAAVARQGGDSDSRHCCLRNPVRRCPGCHCPGRRRRSAVRDSDRCFPGCCRLLTRPGISVAGSGAALPVAD